MLEPVVTMGFPRLEGLLPTLVSSVDEVAARAEPYLDGRAFWITTCAMTGGSSGGPVVGGDGRVVGVVSALPGTGAGVNPGRFGLAVSLAEADRDFLEQAIAAGFGLD